MSPITHFFEGWMLGAATGLNRRGRTLVTLAAVAPDVDGFGIIPQLLTENSAHPLMWYSQYHHALHNLLFAIGFSVLAALVARRWLVFLLCFVSVHLHFVSDVVGSRGPDGYQWPIFYLSPFSKWGWTWSGQWALNGWQNVCITAALLMATYIHAKRQRCSPLSIFSDSLDRKYMTLILRQRDAINAR